MCVGGEEDVRYGLIKIQQGAYNLADAYSGAYCSMVIVSLLALPLELPPNAPARAHGFTSFLDGLPEYLSRCTRPQLININIAYLISRSNLRGRCICCTAE